MRYKPSSTIYEFEKYVEQLNSWWNQQLKTIGDTDIKLLQNISRLSQ